MKVTTFNTYIKHLFSILLFSFFFSIVSCEEQESITSETETLENDEKSSTVDNKKEGNTETENTDSEDTEAYNIDEETPEKETTDEPAELSDAQQLLKLVNQERTALGLQTLVLNNKLSNSAFKHSEDMRLNIKELDHQGSDDSKFSERAERENYSGFARAENIASGYKTPQAVHDAWMNSSGHRKNILLSDITEMGIGRSGNYWTQVFGRN